MNDVDVLDVLLYGEPTATLTRVSDDRILFAFNEAYITNDLRPTLSLGFKDHLGELVTDFRTTRTRALPFFSNLLPEGHLRTYLAERAGVNPGAGILPPVGARHGSARRRHGAARRHGSVADRFARSRGSGLRAAPGRPALLACRRPAQIFGH